MTKRGGSPRGKPEGRATRGRAAAEPPEEPEVVLQITIGAGDARRLMRLGVAAGLTAEACAASIVAEVLADDATCHQGEHGGAKDGAGWDQARWDRAAKAAPAPEGQLQ